MSAKPSYRCDLHIHSCLSPCADLLMTPGNIINEALRIGLDYIAITDHNTAGNVQVAMELAQASKLKIVPGMEVETREEVHLLCLFPSLDLLLAWDQIVDQNLPALKNDTEHFGDQLLTDSNDQYRAHEERLLATATRLSVAETVSGVTKLDGIIIPAHVDKPVNSIIRQLGFIPADSEIKMIEISRNTRPEDLFSKYPYLQEYRFICGSDSHYLDDIGKCGSKNGFVFKSKIEDILFGESG